MTREEAKELLPVIQEFADGKTIEFLNNRNMWEELEDVLFCREPKYYRIKPEPKYRPFKTQEECWNEMLKHRPFGWLKSKKNGSVGHVSTIYTEKDVVVSLIVETNEKRHFSPSEVIDDYVFSDGTPFGIKEE